jgi:hypothetical protein
MKIKVLFFFFLFSLLFIFNQAYTVPPPGVTLLPPDCPEATRCYRFIRGYWYEAPDPDRWVPHALINSPFTGYRGQAFFPGLVPCGVGICINAEWVRWNPDIHIPEQEHVPGWHCPGTFDPEGHHCTICHLFVLFFTVVSFIFLTLVPMLAAVIIAIAGGMIAFARGDPEAVKKGTGTIKGVIIGLLLVYGAFAITSAFFGLLGVIQWEGFGDNLFSVRCCDPIKILVRPPT